MSTMPSLFVLGALGAALAGDLVAQCVNTFTTSNALAGADAEVRAMTTWDPDGAGPSGPVVVVAGAFRAIGSELANGIAAWDPLTSTWSDLSGGMSGVFLGAVTVHALAVLPTGELVAAGQFQNAGGVVATSIARWNGSSWAPFADGIGGYVYALAVLPNGDLVAAGDFFLADGVYVDNVVRWDGSSWHPLGAGLEGTVNALAVLPNGDLIAAGAITASGTTPIGRIARWDGVAWSVLGGGLPGEVHALAARPNGDLFVGGVFANAAGVGANFVVRNTGGSWFALGTGTNDGVFGLGFAQNGDLLAVGRFLTAGGSPAMRIARWNGATWSALGGGITTVQATVRAVAALPGGPIVAGGLFLDADGGFSDHVRRFDGTTWSALSPGSSGVVRCILRLGSGRVFVGGSMPQVDGVPTRGVALWQAGQWLSMGSGLAVGTVRCAVELANGDLVVGGQFASIGGVAAANVARWNGSSWSPLGTGLPDTVRALVLRPGGVLVAGGYFTERVATWNGASWSGTGIAATFPGLDGVRAIVPLLNGDLFVTGSALFGGGFARWDGTTWTPVSSPVGPAWSLAVSGDGDVFAGVGSVVMRWSSGTWTTIGSQLTGNTSLESGVLALAVLPGGELLAGGTFTSTFGPTGTVAVPRLARWNGATWQPVGSGANGVVRTLAAWSPTEVAVGGEFSVVADVLAPRLVRIGTACPASVGTAGVGCTGGGGPNVLVADGLPWLGATFRSVASGMPAQGFVVTVLGFGSSGVPLSAWFPEAVAGCTLAVSPDVLGVALPASGSVALALALPRDPSLVGQVLRQQVVPFEFDPQGALVAITASNALAATLGWY